MATESDLLTYLAERGDVHRLRRELELRLQAIDVPDSRGYTPLFAAARKNRVDVIRLLLELGAKAETRSTSEGQYTPLMIAIIQQQDRAAAVLAEAAADVLVRDEFGRTALHYASDFGKKSIVDILLAKGSDPNPKDSEGRSPTLIAHVEGHEDSQSALQAKGGTLVPEEVRQEKMKVAFDRHRS